MYKKTKKKYNRNPKNVHIGDLIRKNAYIIKKTRSGKEKKIFLKVSPSAVKEYISRIIDSIEINLPEIAETVHRDGRKTIMVKYKGTEKGGLEPIYDDITVHFGHVESKTASGTPEYCSKCLKKMEREK